MPTPPARLSGELSVCLDRLKSWLAPERLEARARETGFMKRKPKTITPLLFVQSAILLVGESVVSFGRWAVMLGLLGHCTVAKQSLWERVSAGALALLQQTLGLVLAERIRARAAALPQGLRAFQRVLIQVIVETFERIALAKAFFLSRLRLDIVLFDPQTQRPLPLLKALRRQGQLDCPVLVGDFFLQLCLEAWQIRIPEALLFQLEYPGRYERRARKNFVQKLMNGSCGTAIPGGAGPTDLGEHRSATFHRPSVRCSVFGVQGWMFNWLTPKGIALIRG
jgi:hypothetical protein